jgi:hypothetical protein
VKKTPSIPKKNKGKENVLDPVEEVRNHVDFHFSNKESSEEIDSLIIPFGGKGDKKATKHNEEVDKAFGA